MFCNNLKSANSFTNTAKVIFLLEIYVLTCSFTISPAFTQGLSEHAAVHAGSAASIGALHNKSTINNITKMYNGVSNMSGSLVHPSGTPAVSKNTSSAKSKRKRFSATELKIATEESNKLYKQAEEKEKAGKLDEAKQLYYQAAISLVRIWGDADPAVTKIVLKIGDIALKQKHHGEARVYYKRSLAALSKTYGSGDFQLVPILSKLAKLEADDKKYDDASGYYEHILLLQEKEFGEESPKCVPTRITVIEQYIAAKDFYEADKIAKKGLVIETKNRGATGEDYNKLQQLSTEIAAGRASNSSK